MYVLHCTDDVNVEFSKKLIALGNVESIKIHLIRVKCASQLPFISEFLQ